MANVVAVEALPELIFVDVRASDRICADDAKKTSMSEKVMNRGMETYLPSLISARICALRSFAWERSSISVSCSSLARCSDPEPELFIRANHPGRTMALIDVVLLSVE